MTEHGPEYEEGVRDGRLAALENVVYKRHEGKFENHEKRLIYLERIAWGMVGVLFLSTMWPRIETLLHIANETAK